MLGIRLCHRLHGFRLRQASVGLDGLDLTLAGLGLNRAGNGPKIPRTGALGSTLVESHGSIHKRDLATRRVGNLFAVHRPFACHIWPGLGPICVKPRSRPKSGLNCSLVYLARDRLSRAR